MYIPENEIEQAILAHLFAVEVFNKPFHVLGGEYEAEIVRGPQTEVDEMGHTIPRPLWDKQGRYQAQLDIQRKGSRNLLDGDVLPISLWVESHGNDIRIMWYLPASGWGGEKEQSNYWPWPPVLG